MSLHFSGEQLLSPLPVDLDWFDGTRLKTEPEGKESFGSNGWDGDVLIVCCFLSTEWSNVGEARRRRRTAMTLGSPGCRFASQKNGWLGAGTVKLLLGEPFSLFPIFWKPSISIPSS